MGKYRILLLDVDDTLLDFQAAEKNGVREVLKSYGVAPDEEKVRIYSEINDGLWKAYERGEILRDTILDTRFQLFFEKLGRAVDGREAEALYRRELDASAVKIEGAQEILDYLVPRYALYVVTNGVSETQHQRLAKAGFDRYMKDVFVSEDAGSQKPRKEFFDYCFRRMGDPGREEMLVIGDSLSSDIRGGNNAGIDTCWFNRMGKPMQEGISVTYEIRRLEELKKIL